MNLLWYVWCIVNYTCDFHMNDTLVRHVTGTCDWARVCSCEAHFSLHWTWVTSECWQLQPQPPPPHPETRMGGRWVGWQAHFGTATDWRMLRLDNVKKCYNQAPLSQLSSLTCHGNIWHNIWQRLRLILIVNCCLYSDRVQTAMVSGFRSVNITLAMENVNNVHGAKW